MTSDLIPICFVPIAVALYLLRLVLVPFYPSQEACDTAECVPFPLLSHVPLPDAIVVSCEFSHVSLYLLSYIKKINHVIIYHVFRKLVEKLEVNYISSSNRYSSSIMSASNSATLSSLRFSKYFLRDSTRNFGTSFSLLSVSIILSLFAASAAANDKQ